MPLPPRPLGAKKPESHTMREKFLLHQDINPNLASLNIEKLSAIRLFEKFIHLPAEVNHIHSLSPVRSQGNTRGTCTAFAVTAANEYNHFQRTGVYPDLSEQYLFFSIKELEADTDCSSYIRTAAIVIARKGQCLESEWVYDPNPPCLQQFGEPANADASALNFINSFIEINYRDLTALKQALNADHLISFSIPVFKEWYDSQTGFDTGVVAMPTPDDTQIDGHAMTIVGYKDIPDQTTPGTEGGGHFIIRNSWGPAFGQHGLYGPGYGTIPYKYITDLCWECYAL